MFRTATPHPRPVPPPPLLLALWLALAGGMLEGTVRLVQRYGFHQVVLVPPHIIWIAPLAAFLWLAPFALLLLLAGQRWRSLRTGVTGAAVLIFLAVLSPLLLITSLHKAVTVFLAAAIATQAARLLRPRLPAFATLVRRTTLPLLLLAAGSALTIAGFRGHGEKRSIARLEPAPPGAPNVLLIIWDTVRRQDLGLYGSDRTTTPYLRVLAKSGVMFRHAFATAPWTLASHASMFTGLPASQVVDNPQSPMTSEAPTLAEELGARGYQTAGFVANLSYGTRVHGLNRGFQHYKSYEFSLPQILSLYRLGEVVLDLPQVREAMGYWDIMGRKDAGEVDDEFLSWLDRRDDTGRPFFAFLNFFDAHRPYIPPPPFHRLFSWHRLDRYTPWLEARRFRDVGPDEISWARAQYDGAIAYQDAELGRLMRQLEARGLLDNTILIVTSDHGEHLGDHNRLGHMNSLYRSLLEVPLVLRYPARVPQGATVTEPVSLRDLPATILALAGTDDSAWPGRSLARFWMGDSRTRAAPVLSEMAVGRRDELNSLVARGYHYIGSRREDRSPELYALSDSMETTDLADSAAYHGLVDWFAAENDSLISNGVGE